MAEHEPRTVSRIFAFTSICIAITLGPPFGQVAWGQTAAMSGNASSALTAFDVVSVKPLKPGGTVVHHPPAPDGVQDTVTLEMLVRMAYGGSASESTKLPTADSVTGLPNWAQTEFFSVQGKLNEAQTAEFAKLAEDRQEERREEMLQALLADRFRLKVHREPKTVPYYELVVTKGGLKIKHGDIDPKDFVKLDLPRGQLTAKAITMEQLTQLLMVGPIFGLDRPVKDKTGLTGKYSFVPHVSQGGLIPSASSPTDSGPSIFSALQEDLGLKLQPGMGTIYVVVVDHVERPSQN